MGIVSVFTKRGFLFRRARFLTYANESLYCRKKHVFTNEILWTSEDSEFAPAHGSTSGSLYSERIQLCPSDVAVSNSVTVIASLDKTCAAPLCGFFEFIPPSIIVRVKITVWRNRMWKWLNLSWKHLSEVVYWERLNATQGLSLNL